MHRWWCRIDGGVAVRAAGSPNQEQQKSDYGVSKWVLAERRSTRWTNTRRFIEWRPACTCIMNNIYIYVYIYNNAHIHPSLTTNWWSGANFRNRNPFSFSFVADRAHRWVIGPLETTSPCNMYGRCVVRIIILSNIVCSICMRYSLYMRIVSFLAHLKQSFCWINKKLLLCYYCKMIFLSIVGFHAMNATVRMSGVYGMCHALKWDIFFLCDVHCTSSL